MKGFRSLLAAAPLVWPAAAAQAQSGPSAAGASGAPAAAETICTDRPTKANVACTVPAGAIQIETDLVNWTVSTAPGVRSDTVLYTNPTIKYGVGGSTDVEINIAPYATVRTRASGTTGTLGSVGDLYIRLKQRLTAADAGTDIAIIPYVKAPVAALGVGNGAWEGGVIAPIQFALPAAITLNFGPEVDILADGDGHGHHAQLVGLANVSRSFGKATLYAELWSAQNFDPAATVHQYSADVAASYLIGPRWQIDAGGNFGLNRATPDAQLYLGVSTRF